MVGLLAGHSAGAADCAPAWPLWEAYADRFISPDGRVIDATGGGITTSEGQSYALFFSLVANDRVRFHRVLDWTRDNLFGGRWDRELPAYKWGPRADGSWGVLDGNSAADADLWMGYVLVEAGRLWRDVELERTGRMILDHVVAHEVARLPGLGAMLLPAPRGFVQGRLWRLNPSYLPLQLLRGLESDRVPGPWRELRAHTIRMIQARSSRGFVDDWVGYRPGAGFVTDPVKGAIGSYDAIRVYLWHAMLNPGDKEAIRLGLDGPWDYWRKSGRVPERIDARRPKSGARPGPVGFLAVLLPRAARAGKSALARLTEQIERARHGDLYGSPPTYYDHNLLLFAQGFLDRHYRFSVDGRIVPAWTDTCAAPERPP
jgi:endoglucanase